jgi:hypothetical protein
MRVEGFETIFSRASISPSKEEPDCFCTRSLAVWGFSDLTKFVRVPMQLSFGWISNYFVAAAGLSNICDDITFSDSVI